MSYHDGYTRPGMEGKATVNPLIRIERKFSEIKKLLANDDALQDLSAIDLKKMIEQVLKE